MPEPARALRPRITEKRFSETGSSGAPTLTKAPSVFSRDRYWSRLSGAETVDRIRSKLPASSSKVFGSLVA